MDLTVNIDNTSLNIRVAVFIKTKNGYVLEKNRHGYYFFVGGRIKINETSEEAAKREVLEEIGMNIEKLNFKTIIENFYVSNEEKPFHELCFVYMADGELEIPKLPENIEEISVANFNNLDIRPKVLKDYVMNNDDRSHAVCKDGN